MYPLREDGWISLLQHLLELLVGGRSPRWKKQRDSFVSQTDATQMRMQSIFHQAVAAIIYSTSDGLDRKYRYCTNTDLISIIIIYIISLLHLITLSHSHYSIEKCKNYKSYKLINRKLAK